MTKNFLGIRIDGEITPGKKRENQRPLGEFAPIMQAILDDPTIAEFGWTQYTPYFNDGEPCEFGVSGPWVRTTADDPDTETHDLGVDGYSDHPSLGKIPRTFDRKTREYVYGAYEGPDEARYRRCEKFGEAIESGQFLDVLLEAFGDHALVTVRRDGIDVSFYDHD